VAVDDQKNFFIRFLAFKMVATVVAKYHKGKLSIIPVQSTEKKRIMFEITSGMETTIKTTSAM
jgi:hypothetical protein